MKLILVLVLTVVLASCVLPTTTTTGRPPVSPLIPNEVPALLENQWRLTEIIHNGARRGFESIDPVIVQFSPGSLSYWACNAGTLYFDTTGIEDPNEYRLRSGPSTAMGCGYGGTEQETNLLQALRATNRYEIVGDTLILSGEHARITFVIDNETVPSIER